MFNIVVMFNIIGGEGFPITQEVRYVVDDFRLSKDEHDNYLFFFTYEGKNSQIVVAKEYFVGYTINQVGEALAPSSETTESSEVDGSSPKS